MTRWVLFSAYNNLIYDNGNGAGAALGVDFDILETVNLAVGYWATNLADSAPGNGLFICGKIAKMIFKFILK